MCWADDARAWVEPKSSEKCSLIVNTLPTNRHCVPRGLPTLDRLTMIVELAALKGEQLFFAKSDISNIFWACQMTQEYQHSARIILPIGWIANPVLVQRLLAMYLVEAFPGEVVGEVAGHDVDGKKPRGG